MSSLLLDKVIKVLKLLLKIDNIEIMKCTIESLLDELEELKINKKRK